MKISFLIMALRSLSKTASKMIELFGMDAKFVLLQEVIEYSELTSRYRWLKLMTDYRDELQLKRTTTLELLHAELKEMMKNFPELQNHNLSNGDPFLKLLTDRALAGHEVIGKHGNNAPVLLVDDVESVVDAVMTYNFAYTYKKQLGDRFKEAESKMSDIAKANRWPARGSWNAFVPKEERKKRVANFDWMAEYTSEEI